MKNIHLDHPEDSILTGTLAVLDAFLMTHFLSVKIDGAPAIVWGKNPATGNFFVGTKSVFNKKKIKINECHADIDQNLEGRVAEILHACFDYLPWTDQIIQGDFIGFGGEQEYTPNTITYEFASVVDAVIIIAPHTVYTAESDLRDAVAAPLTDEIVDPEGDCKFVQPVAYVCDGSWGEMGIKDFKELRESVEFAKVMASAVDFVDEKEAKRLIKVFNACIRQGIEIESYDFPDNESVVNFWLLVKSIKEDALHLCRYAHGPNAYIDQERITAEGFVMHTDLGSWKLVNREVFSHANFNMGIGAPA